MLCELSTPVGFFQISFNAISAPCPDEEIRYLNYDTTSTNVYGEYDLAENTGGSSYTTFPDSTLLQSD